MFSNKSLLRSTEDMNLRITLVYTLLTKVFGDYDDD